MSGRDYTLRGLNVFNSDNKLVATLSAPGKFTTSDGCHGNFDPSGKVYVMGICIGITKPIKIKA